MVKTKGSSSSELDELTLKIALEIAERLKKKKVWTQDEIEKETQEVYAKYKEEIKAKIKARVKGRS